MTKENKDEKLKTPLSQSELNDLLSCSFCKKKAADIKWMVAGPGIFICDECVKICSLIIEQEEHKLKISEYEEMLEQSDKNIRDILKGGKAR